MAALYGDAPSAITAPTFPAGEKWGDDHLAALFQTLSGRRVGQRDHLFSPDIDSCLEETEETLARGQVDR